MSSIKKKKSKSIKNKTQIGDETKLNHEIRLLKLKYRIAIFSFFIAIAGFVISHFDFIKRGFYPEPRIRVHSEDIYIKDNSVIQIENLKEKKIYLKGGLDYFKDWKKIPEGPYELKVMIKNKKFWDTPFTVSAGERKPIVIPSLFSGRIYLDVDLSNVEPVAPRESLEFVIKTNGNGYLWMFEKLDSGLKILYPHKNDASNYVQIKRELRLTQYRAGPEEGLCTHIFLITSLNDQNYAFDLANQITGLTILKTAISKDEPIWGYAKLTYKIEKLIRDN